MNAQRAPCAHQDAAGRHTLTTYADGMTCLQCGVRVPWRDLLALLENDRDSAGGQGVDPI
jgi:hypothetical protein